MKKRIIGAGKRKTSVARAVLTEGQGRIIFNGTSYKNLHEFDRLKLIEPVRIAENVLGKIDFDVDITVRGGGEKSRIDASRIALAKAIVKFSNSKNLQEVYGAYDKTLLVADVRRKEAYKPG